MNTKFQPTRRGFAAIAATLAAGTALAACSSDDSGSGSDSTNGEITLGYVPSWTDGLSTAYLLKNQLEGAGYTVNMEELDQPGLIYTAVAQGDIDIFCSAWPEVTQAAYMEQYGDDIEDLDTYYDGAKLTWGVPSYSAMTSIEDIPNFADQLDNKITGIEAGAGLTSVAQEDVIPGYGLDEDGFELVTSSTAAMLAELSSAIDSEEEIVVTLWRPFWANSTYDVRDLEDPKGLLGEGEGLHFLARKGFSEEQPEIAEWIGSISMDDDTYNNLENTVVNDYGEGKYDEAVQAWLEENPDYQFSA